LINDKHKKLSNVGDRHQRSPNQWSAETIRHRRRGIAFKSDLCVQQYIYLIGESSRTRKILTKSRVKSTFCRAFSDTGKRTS